jgi:hypothetical protein
LEKSFLFSFSLLLLLSEAEPFPRDVLTLLLLPVEVAAGEIQYFLWFGLVGFAFRSSTFWFGDQVCKSGKVFEAQLALVQ